jgi:hypothetical protein
VIREAVKEQRLAARVHCLGLGLEVTATKAPPSAGAWWGNSLQMLDALPGRYRQAVVGLTESGRQHWPTL